MAFHPLIYTLTYIHMHTYKLTSEWAPEECQASQWLGRNWPPPACHSQLCASQTSRVSHRLDKSQSGGTPHTGPAQGGDICDLPTTEASSFCTLSSLLQIDLVSVIQDAAVYTMKRSPRTIVSNFLLFITLWWLHDKMLHIPYWKILRIPDVSKYCLLSISFPLFPPVCHSLFIHCWHCYPFLWVKPTHWRDYRQWYQPEICFSGNGGMGMRGNFSLSRPWIQSKCLYLLETAVEENCEGKVVSSVSLTSWISFIYMFSIWLPINKSCKP